MVPASSPLVGRDLLWRRHDRQFVAVAAADAVTVIGAPVMPKLAELRELGRVAATDQDEHTAEEALRLAHQLVADAYPISD